MRSASGATGLMVLPAMVYVPTPAELEYHFRAVAEATGLPIMLYNNPPSYRVNIDLATLARLAEIPNIVALKESAPDPRRFTDLINAFGERFTLFAGLDDLVFEGLTLGAKGWVSGLTNAFPAESLLLYEALRSGDLERARSIYRWFMPLLHLDAEHDLVQSIKLAEQIMGRGSERVRPPRLPLAGERRAAVTAMIERARDTPPGNAPIAMARIRVIDSHTGGEPTRLVIDGGPAVGSGPLAERVQRFREHFDAYRSAIVNEPRGSDPLVGALLVKPQRADCDFGVIFFNNVGFLGMCGHGTIGLIASLRFAGELTPGTVGSTRRSERSTQSCMRTAASASATWRATGRRTRVAVEVPGSAR